MAAADEAELAAPLAALEMELTAELTVPAPPPMADVRDAEVVAATADDCAGRKESSGW